MVSSSVLFLLFVGAISAAPVVEDGWTDVVSAGAEVAGNAGKVVLDIFKLIGDFKDSKRDVQDGWKEIATAGVEVLGNGAKVVIDVAKLIGDIKGKRDVPEEVAAIVAAVDAKIAKVVEDALKFLEGVEKRQEVQDGWGSIIVDGATTVKDVIDLGKSVKKLVDAIGK